MESSTPIILGILFLATLVRSTFGFGESLVAVPLLLLLIPIEVAVPLSVLLSVLVATVVVVQDRKQVEFHSAKWLVIYAATGIPFGLLLLMYGNQQLVKIFLGLLIILYSLYALFFSKKHRKQDTSRKKQPWLYLCGFFSGILGGAYGLNGPPLVIYGNSREWSSQEFRATLQAYFLPASTLGMLGYWLNGLWTWEVTRLFLISLPAVVLAIFLGRFFNHQLREASFKRYVYIGLLAIGGLLATTS